MQTETLSVIKPKPKPKWLRVKLPTGKKYKELRGLVDKYDLHTICTSGSCPNMGECWSEGTATFMILGDICTRACRYCNVKTGRPSQIDIFEPSRVANTVKQMGLSYSVVTSVDRDDLVDGGAGAFAMTIKQIKKFNPDCKVEVLIPDSLIAKENFRARIIAIDRRGSSTITNYKSTKITIPILYNFKN